MVGSRGQLRPSFGQHLAGSSVDLLSACRADRGTTHDWAKPCGFTRIAPPPCFGDPSLPGMLLSLRCERLRVAARPSSCWHSQRARRAKTWEARRGQLRAPRHMDEVARESPWGGHQSPERGPLGVSRRNRRPGLRVGLNLAPSAPPSARKLILSISKWVGCGPMPATSCHDASKIAATSTALGQTVRQIRLLGGLPRCEFDHHWPRLHLSSMIVARNGSPMWGYVLRRGQAHSNSDQSDRAIIDAHVLHLTIPNSDAVFLHTCSSSSAFG